MIKIEHLDVFGFETAIRGMRNPMNSWDKSDMSCQLNKDNATWDIRMGENDLRLMKKLFKAGTEHRKYMRQIMISMDITAPLYWWKEFDTYKVGTTANSCSTMHKIHAKEFTLDDFSTEHLQSDSISVLTGVIHCMNVHREWFINKSMDDPKEDWWQMIQLLPTSYNQKRTVTLNYEVAYRIIEQRSHHKLDEWHVLVDEFKKLPYMMDIIGGIEND